MQRVGNELDEANGAASSALLFVGDSAFALHGAERSQHVAGERLGVGIAQGAAQALYEGIFYDDDGNPITGNLMDYAIPSAAELPSFETHNTETPSPRNPLGAKGIGESGTIGSTPAIHNAVVDAVSHLGVKHIDMPLTAMTVWDAIQAADA